MKAGFINFIFLISLNPVKLVFLLRFFLPALPWCVNSSRYVFRIGHVAARKYLSSWRFASIYMGFHQDKLQVFDFSMKTPTEDNLFWRRRKEGEWKHVKSTCNQARCENFTIQEVVNTGRGWGKYGADILAKRPLAHIGGKIFSGPSYMSHWMKNYHGHNGRAVDFCLSTDVGPFVNHLYQSLICILPIHSSWKDFASFQ